MERLTKWNGKKWVLPQGQWREIAERLAAYENTGLEPYEILSTVKTNIYIIEATSGECYLKEVCIGTPEEAERQRIKVSNMVASLGWHDAEVKVRAETCGNS